MAIITLKICQGEKKERERERERERNRENMSDRFTLILSRTNTTQTDEDHQTELKEALKPLSAALLALAVINLANHVTNSHHTHSRMNFLLSAIKGLTVCG